MIKSFLKTGLCCLLGVMICSFWGCGRGCQCGFCKGDQETEKTEVIKCECCTCESCECNLKNKEREFVRKSLSEGIDYEVINEGEGDITPKKGQTVVVHYTGWLDENGKPGKKFDSSVDRGQKFSFQIGVAQVIKGWDDGVISMKKGEKRRLYIASDLAYGQRGVPGVIPPGSALIFDVQLFDFY